MGVIKAKLKKLGRYQSFAYAGKILRVNLSEKTMKVEPTQQYIQRFIGGRGISQWILYNETKPLSDPFHPNTRLIFGTGALVGTKVPGACRYTVDSKNVLTGGVGSANSGGYFGPELKFSGFDYIIFEGRCDKPCYLWVNNGRARIESAEHLWGKTTGETEDIIRQIKGPKVRIASIGPAGENLVYAACIINDRGRAAARCGLGAVMGSKNLKAVAVRGEQELNIADPVYLNELVDKMLERINKNKVMNRDRKYGTSWIHERDNEIGGSPVHNFQDGYWDPKKIKNIGSENFLKYQVEKFGCFGCPLSASRYLYIPSGPYQGVGGEGFQCNTFKDFGPKLGIDYLPGIIRAHTLCTELGLDVDNSSGVIAWCMECYEKGIFSQKELNNLDLSWGNHKAVNQLLQDLAYRKGIGDLLANGSKRASGIIGKGSKRYSMNIKGQELYEPLRYAKGWALGVIISPRGSGHLRGAPTTEFQNLTPEEGIKFFGVPTAGDRRAYEGKAKLVSYFAKFKAVVDAMGVCYNITQWSSPDLINPKDLAEAYSAATGIAINKEKLMKVGERIDNIEKAFNIREGMSRADDQPPARIFDETIKSGPTKGEKLDYDKFQKMLNEYYEIRGWDTKTGRVSKSKLEELELPEVAEDLAKYRII